MSRGTLSILAAVLALRFGCDHPVRSATDREAGVGAGGCIRGGEIGVDVSRTSRNIRNVMGPIDDGWEGFWRRATKPPRATILVGLVAVGVLALAAIPIRDTVGTANIALSMGIVVVIVGARSGLWPGTIVAVASGAAFALWHTVPHGLPQVETGQDAVTAALLVVSGVVAGWMHDRTERLRTELRDTDQGFSRLHRVAEVAVAPHTTVDQVISAVTSEISSELRLLECHREVGPLGSLRELQHNGLLAGAPFDLRPPEIGMMVAAGVGIDLRDGSHLVLTGRPDTDVSHDQLRISIMLADYAAALLERQ